ETSVARQLAPLSIIILTQAPTDADLLSILLDDALAGHDARVVCCLYSAPPDADPFDIATIKQANPALGIYQNPQEVMSMAEDAKRMPSRGGLPQPDLEPARRGKRAVRDAAAMESLQRRAARPARTRCIRRARFERDEGFDGTRFGRLRHQRRLLERARHVLATALRSERPVAER